MAITVPKSEASGFVNNKKEVYKFQYLKKKMHSIHLVMLLILKV